MNRTSASFPWIICSAASIILNFFERNARFFRSAANWIRILAICAKIVSLVGLYMILADCSSHFAAKLTCDVLVIQQLVRIWMTVTFLVVGWALYRFASSPPVYLLCFLVVYVKSDLIHENILETPSNLFYFLPFIYVVKLETGAIVNCPNDSVNLNLYLGANCAFSTLNISLAHCTRLKGQLTPFSTYLLYVPQYQHTMWVPVLELKVALY